MATRTMTAGRKRTFDKEEALNQAMQVFWRNGYSGTSMNDLTSALGINKPSLYAAFGNKEQLFDAALRHYMSLYGGPLFDRLTESTDTPLSNRLRNYLFGIVDLTSDRELPTGCLFVKSNCESGGEAIPEEIAESLRELGSANEQALTKFLRSEQRRGELPSTTNPRELAGYLISVMYGLSVLARSGKSRKQLRAIVDIAVASLPAAEV